MSRFREVRVDTPGWGPLEQLCSLTARTPGLPAIDPDSFMYMARLRSRAGIDVHLYKHIETRRYLNLDDAGHAYTYVHDPAGLSGDDAGEYRLLDDLRDALGRLDLDLLHPAPAPLEEVDHAPAVDGVQPNGTLDAIRAVISLPCPMSKENRWKSRRSSPARAR